MATSIIECKFSNEENKYLKHGTGFFYNILEPVNNSHAQHVKETYLITNRHIIIDRFLKDEIEIFADSLKFSLKKVELTTNKIQWDYIEINKKDISSRLKIYEIKEIDVAAIKVNDLINDKLKNMTQKQSYIAHRGITDSFIPKRYNGELETEVGDDILVIGYPNMYYDLENKYPIVKSGIIATSLYNNFNGEPCFLIDAKLFPGSSGSLVISKPHHFSIINGEVKYSEQKRFDFLGVFSGEPHFHKDKNVKTLSVNVGKVWRWDIIRGLL